MNRFRRLTSALVVMAAFGAATFVMVSQAAAVTEKIVYQGYGLYGGIDDIFIMNPDGTEQTNLTVSPPDTPDWIDREPELSADGTRIAFISNRVTEQNPDGNLEIFTMNTDGSNISQVTVTQDPFGQASSYASYGPTWSPDGTRIAFDGYRGGGASQIYVINADGTGETRLTNPADYASKWQPDWSPDGSKILFTWGWDEWTQDLHSINPDGTGETNLTPEANPELDQSAQRSAVWSPDGKRIAFQSDHLGGGVYPNPNHEIWIIEYPSLTWTQVTDNQAIDADPTWSPDGTQIAFLSTREGGYRMFSIAAPAAPAPAFHGTATYDTFTSSSTTYRTQAAATEAPVKKLNVTGGDPYWGSTGGTTPPPASYLLTVSKKGRGKVTSNPTGITCGRDCTESYAANSVVTLTAKPGSGSVFSGWGGACSGTATTCAVTMSAAKTVTASFTKGTTTPPGAYTLTVTKAGTGRGGVQSSPSGISCGTDCTETYPSGTTVTLTARVGSGSLFAGWSGACTGTGTCTVTMNASKSVTATFNTA